MKLIYYVDSILSDIQLVTLEAKVREKLRLQREDGLLIIQTTGRVPGIVVLGE